MYLKTVEWSPVQPPAPLFNKACHCNSLALSRTSNSLRFCWALAVGHGPNFVHAVCLDENGLAVDPTLGDYGRELFELYKLDHPAPRTFAEAETGLMQLRQRWENWQSTPPRPGLFARFWKWLTT